MTISFRREALITIVLFMVVALFPVMAFAQQDESSSLTDTASSDDADVLAWDPDDPSSWRADESPFYSDAQFDMTLDQMLEIIAEYEGTQENGSDSDVSGSHDNQGEASGSISTQSLSLKTTNKLIAAGCRYYGLPYIFGGRYLSQGGFDCTGFIIQCISDVFGYEIDRAYTTADKLYDNYCTPVSAEDAKPGDLVFWRGTYGLDKNWISHVGIYCGGNIAFCSSDIVQFKDITKVRYIGGGYAPYLFGTLKNFDEGDVTNDYFETITDEDGNQTVQERTLMWRLYNRYSGEHLFTLDREERDYLALIGWVYEGVCWEAPHEGDEIYRLYNPNSGDHHFTTDVSERDHLDSIGWNYEGVGWLSKGQTPVYRLFNPNATVGTHHYTTSKDEYDWLITLGWRGEGIAWYSL